MSLEIIGAGFGRTGTLSLKAALEQLGFTRCHHMLELVGDPEQRRHWNAIARGETPPWEQVFQGFRASCDFPSCIYWAELLRAFPGSRVILTTRDPERWYASVAATIYPLSTGMPRWLRWLRGDSLPTDMIDTIVWQGLFEGRFEDEQRALEIFRAHEQRVMQGVPPERLLVFDPSQGWEPLCHFLGVPVPDTPFPHLNDSESFARAVRRLRLLRRAPWIAAGLLLAIALVLLLR